MTTLSTYSYSINVSKLSGAKLSGAKLSGAKVSYNPDRICNKDLKKLFFLSLFSKPLFLCVKKPFPVDQSWRKAGVTAQALCAGLIHLEEIHEDRSTRLSNSLGAPLVLFKDRINLLDYKILQREWIKGKCYGALRQIEGGKRGAGPKV